MHNDWQPPNSEFPPPKPGEPPLFRAARVGDHRAIRSLIADGADPNAVFDIGLDPSASPDPATPLMVAAGSGDGATIETVRLLLELGADPRLVFEQQSAATFAVRGLGWNYRPGGDAARLRAVLDAGARMPLAGAPGASLVSDAAGSGDPERLRALLERGANPNPHWDPEEAAQDAARMRAAMRSYRSSTNLPPALADTLSKYPELEAEIEETESEFEQKQASAPSSHDIPLFRAAESGSAECVRILLDAGADPMIRDNGSQTAMYVADSPEVAMLLKSVGVPVEGSDWLEWSPLIHAVSDGETSRVRALLAAGADVNATHDRGYTVFMSAASSMCRNVAVMRLLVEAGADALAITELGYNAFHAAIDVNGEANAEASVRATFSCLKSLGVDIEHRNNAGQSPLARAIDWGTGTEVRVLCELGANPNAPARFHRCREDACKAVEEPPLVAAAKGGVDGDEKVEALLRAGADPLAKDSEGYTALVHAVAKLSRDSDDYEQTFRRFFEGLRSLRGERGLHAMHQDAYLRAVRPALREYVQAFAAVIPVDSTWEFAEEWRHALLRTIELLAAYEEWARWQQTRGQSTDPEPRPEQG